MINILRLHGWRTGSLGFRLGMTLVLALLPLGILSVVQAKMAQSQIEQAALSGIVGASMQAAQPQSVLIRTLQVTASLLSKDLARGIPNDPDCIALMRRVMDNTHEIAFVGLVLPSGQATCTSTGKSYDFTDDLLFEKLMGRPGATISFTPHGLVTGIPVIGIGQPVLAQKSGKFLGMVMITIPHRLAAPQIYADQYTVWRPLQIATLSGDGTLLALSQVEPGAGQLPSGLPLDRLASLNGTSFYTTGPNPQIVAVTSVAQDFYVLTTWTRDIASLGGTSPYLLPTLTWAAALGAAALASGRLVVRHIRTLSRAMMAFSTDRARSHLTTFADAPDEIRTLCMVYEEMIRTIDRDEAELQNLLIDKDLLLREVNHRAGNNLQIIASVMRLYRRETADPELRNVLDGLINRVIALASTHITLFTQSGLRCVPMDAMLLDVINRLNEVHAIPLGMARKRFQPIRLPPQTGIPLALALAEVVSCHFAGRRSISEGIEITLDEEGDEICLRIEGPRVPEFEPATTAGITALPRRMLDQFAAQLHGHLSIQIEGTRSVVRVCMPKPDPDLAV